MTNETITTIESVANATASVIEQVMPPEYLGLAQQVVAIAGATCVIASIITASTATPSPDTVLGKVYRVIEVLALVVGKAKLGGKVK